MDRKYIGLARRELLLAKKSIIVNLITYLVLMLIAVLIYTSIRSGNMKQWVGEDIELAEMLLPMFKILFVLMGAVIPITAFCSSYDENMIGDFQCGWQRYSYTLPVSIEEQIKLKFGMKVVGFFPALILGLINLFVITAASGEALAKRDWLIFAGAVCLGLVMAFMQLPLIMKTRSGDKAGMAASALGMIFGLGIIVKLGGVSKAFIDKHGLSSVEDMPIELQPEFSKELMSAIEGLSAYAWVLAILAAAVIAVSVVWTRKMLKERIC